LREIPTDSNQEALDFAGRLIHGEFDLVIFLTGVGVRRLIEIVETRYDRFLFLEALRRIKVASRGPKVSAALRELGVPIAVTAPEPCTWHEVMGVLDGTFGPELQSLRVAVQEYGATNPDLLAALSKRKVRWTRVPVYHWALPDDLEPLKNAVRSIGATEIDVILFLTAMQVAHLFQVAEGMGASEQLRHGMRSTLLLSIGPSTTEELEKHGMRPDFTPSHPKMGVLMHEASACAGELLEKKRSAAAPPYPPRK
jgi:uroporphyrinogen-III synthase